MTTISNNDFWLIQQAANFKDKIALQDSNERLSYAEFFEVSVGAAKYFSSIGIKESEHVGILFSHKIDFWIIVNSLWFIGAVPVPLNTRNTIAEINEQIKSANITFLIVNTDFNEYSDSAKPNSALSKFKICLFNRKDAVYRSQRSALSVQHSEFCILNSALIMFTSGSSGKSKAVVHTFESLFESVRQMDSFCNLTRDDVWLASLPFYHIGGFMILVRALIAGSQIVLPDSLKHEKIVLAFKQFRPSHISIVPTTLHRMLNENIKPHKELKYVFLGGGPSNDLLCLNAFNSGWLVVKVYGSTETCSMVTALLPNELGAHASSSGRAIGENKIAIQKSNESDNETGGEILVSGKSLFKEYLNDPNYTREKLSEGWFNTGDLGYIDGEGYLFVYSRRNDIIITGGENVSAQEVEAAIKTIPGINEVFVFAMDDAGWGQIVCAAISSTIKNEDGIRASLKEKLAGYKIPKRIYFVESIPQNEMGKIKRAELFAALKLG